MPTLLQLQAEPWWGREVVTAELDRLGDRLCSHFGRPRSAAGTKGDEDHLRGAHRSQEWLLNSIWCTNRTYTVQSGLSAWQLRLIAGSDFTPGVWGTAANRALMVQLTSRAVAAAKAGRLPGVIEIGGTLDGRIPFGWHVVQRRTLSFDSSHLDHLHLTHDRMALEDRAVMDNLFNVLIGADDMDQTEPLIGDTGFAGRRVGDVFVDVENLRNWLVSPPGAAVVAAPPPGSVGALILEAARRQGAHMEELRATLAAIAAKVDLDPAELDAIKTAAAAGAEAGVTRGADELAAALAPLLDVDVDAMKAALAEVLGQARIVVAPPA